jgi:predicted ATPase/class 3 adenylate cyclase
MKYNPPKKPAALVEPLTRRELEILALLAANRSNAEIAQSLSLALSSVKWYAQQIYSKLGVNSRKHAVVRARELGILEQPGPPTKDTPSLPTGTITFLFTDIEGSTLLWEQMPEAMRASVTQHRTILRQSIESNGGQVFQILGDSFQAAFRLAYEGVCAALAAQRALRDAQWGPTGPLKIRMGLHAGPAELDEGSNMSYQVGYTLNRAAHIMSIGYGGQILLSLEAADLVERELPEGVELRDIGQHCLKGMRRLEHLYQLIVADLPQNFQPLSTGVSIPHNLPAQLSSFIGREKEIADLQELLITRHARLVTLTGSGGTGKTRLALQAAEQILDAFPQGIWLVELAPLSDPSLVIRAVAVVLGVQEDQQRSILQALIAYLHNRKTLLIIDNCEHIIVEAAALAGHLLHACPQLHILATSREILGVEGETPFHCPSLSFPIGQSSMESLVQYEAVRLFVERAQTISPSFTLTESNGQLVARICQRLDGIPLAIELAAARLRAFSIEQIAVRLDQAFRLLTDGSRTSLPRHQTLKALIDWSYNLLTDQERLLFNRLSIFSGGWSLEAVEAICLGEGIDPDNIFDLMARLVDRSMVIAEEQEEQPRYRLLETLRQYASQALQESGQQAYWYGRHLEYYLNVAEEVEPQLRSSEDILGVQQLTRENDNLRTAFETAVQGQNTKAMLRLSGALYYFWYRIGRIQEGMNQTLQAIQMPNIEQHPMELANALQGLGEFYWLSGSYQNAIKSLNRSIDLARTVGTPARYVLALALDWRGLTHMRLMDFVSAQRDGEDSRALFQELHDAYGLGNSNYALGRISIEQGKLQAALPFIEQALKWSRTAGDRLLIALVLNDQMLIAISNGDYTTAQALNQESLEIARRMNDLWLTSGRLREAGNLAQLMGDYSNAFDYFLESGEIVRQQGLINDYARNRFNLGYVAVQQGDLDSGRSFLRESWELFSQLNLERGLVECIDGFALLAGATGQSELAACLLGASDALFQSLGATRWPVDQHEYDKLRSRMEEILGVEAFTFQYTRGQKLGLKQALEAADGV